jgi:hypothetical protein
MKTHNVLNVELYPNFHKWFVNSYISLFANTQVSEGDVVKYNGEQYLLTAKNVIDNITSQKASSWLVQSREHPFIKKETNYYEFKIQKI